MTSNKFFLSPKNPKLLIKAAVTAICFLILFGAAIHFNGFGKEILWIAGIMLLSLLLCFIRLPKASWFHTIVFLLTPAALFVLTECFYRVPWNGDMSASIIALNLLFFYLVAFILFFAVGRANFSLGIAIILFGFAGAANYYITLFRSSPILPWDLASIRTAVSVANNFTFSMTYSVCIIIALFLLLLIIASRCTLRVKNFFRRFLFAGISFLFITLYVNFLHRSDLTNIIQINHVSFFPKWMCEENGLAVNFIYNCQFINPEVPDGYSAEKAQELLAPFSEEVAQISDKKTPQVSSPILSVPEVPYIEFPYTADGRYDFSGFKSTNNQSDADADPKQESETESDSDSNPNIIVLMNETFSDPAVLGDFTTNEDYLPFLHWLQEQQPENTITGNLHVSVVGGNTANSEFEFLTGDTMAFLPSGSIAYQQYVRSYLPNIADGLKEQGYETYAMHPFYKSGWNRPAVYSYFGFEHTHFLDQYADEPILRNYISDEGCVNHIIDLYENKDDSPLFLFNVTMQNHSDYTESFENFNPTVHVEGASGEALDNYLSLIQHSDQALESLINYFSSADEDTIIVMFGDHQPNDSVVEPIYEANGFSLETLTPEQQQNRYVVPYVIWANYDIPEMDVPEISTNYLGSLVLDLAGVSKSPYQKFLSELRNTYPVISTANYQDADGVSYKWDDYSFDSKINDYKIVQYDLLFGNK